ncbi:MAG: FecR domain-containing protein [Methyloversatilis sp.]|jgi:hypothetical protein|nr:FecR domain-containing protein [Methyloversatilis sp.]
MAKPFTPARMALAIALAFPLHAVAETAARVEFTSGDVRALAADGSSRVLARGAQVGSGDTVDTGSGRAQMRFTDGSLVSLQPQTQFRIDQYAFAGKPAEDRGFFSLIKGGLRTITGLVGKGNRSNYKLTTSVATIGIRGTQFSVVYGNSINVTTGEGAVDVCNGAGCLTVSDGQSAYVADQNTQPVITEVKTDLPPPPPSNSGSLTPPQGDDTFLVSENRSEGGGLDVLDGYAGGSLQSGDGYYVYGQYVDQYGGYGGTVMLDSATASFEGDALVTASNSNGDIQAASVAEAHQDGIIGWGRWASGSCSGEFSCAGDTLLDVHYIAGRPTPDLAALGGATGTYSLSGYTTPTTTGGASGGPVSGAMIADFSAYTLNVGMNVTVSATTFGLTGSGSINSGTAAFSGSFSNCSGCSFSPPSGSFHGFFAGAGAERAGMVYTFDSGIGGINKVSGAAVFTQISPGLNN